MKVTREVLDQCHDCIYNPIARTIHSLIHDGKEVWTQKPVAEYMADKPGAEVWTFDNAFAHMRAGYLKPASVVTKERFWEMLEVLPPVDWKRSDTTESFKISERTIADLTSIFARIGDQYFELCDSCKLSHDQIIARCRASLQPIVRLECCCCGDSTMGRQWFNRDTGYGLCVSCVEFCNAGQNESCYGIQGYHFGLEGAAQ